MEIRYVTLPTLRPMSNCAPDPPERAIAPPETTAQARVITGEAALFYTNQAGPVVLLDPHKDVAYLTLAGIGRLLEVMGELQQEPPAGVL